MTVVDVCGVCGLCKPLVPESDLCFWCFSMQNDESSGVE